MVRDMLDNVLLLTRLVTTTLWEGAVCVPCRLVVWLQEQRGERRAAPLVNMTRNMDGLPHGVSAEYLAEWFSNFYSVFFFFLPNIF